MNNGANLWLKSGRLSNICILLLPVKQVAGCNIYITATCYL